MLAGGVDRAHHGAGVGEIDGGGEFHPHVLFEPRDQAVELLHKRLDARLHQRRHRGGEQVKRRLFAAAQTGRVAAIHRAVVVLVEQQGFQRTNLLVEAVDAAVFLGSGRQVEPKTPVLAQALD